MQAHHVYMLTIRPGLKQVDGEVLYYSYAADNTSDVDELVIKTMPKTYSAFLEPRGTPMYITNKEFASLKFEIERRTKDINRDFVEI